MENCYFVRSTFQMKKALERSLQKTVDKRQDNLCVANQHGHARMLALDARDTEVQAAQVSSGGQAAVREAVLGAHYVAQDTALKALSEEVRVKEQDVMTHEDEIIAHREAIQIREANARTREARLNAREADIGVREIETDERIAQAAAREAQAGLKHAEQNLRAFGIDVLVAEKGSVLNP